MPIPANVTVTLHAQVPATTGADVEIISSLPDTLYAMRPDEIRIHEAEDWLVRQIWFGGAAQLARLIPATEIPSAVRAGGFQTIQYRMPIKILASPRRDGLTLRCDLSGPGVRRESDIPG
jgi:hypothetical protein